MKKYVFILFLSAITITASAQKGNEKGNGEEKQQDSDRKIIQNTRVSIGI